MADPKPMLLVAAAALIDADGRVLICQRPEGKQLAGLWEFPGGKVEPGETPEQCLIRELDEDLDSYQRSITSAKDNKGGGGSKADRKANKAEAAARRAEIAPLKNGIKDAETKMINSVMRGSFL